MTTPAKHTGSCQCGRVKFEATLGLDACIECNCSHCYRKGLILTFVPPEAFTLTQGAEALSEHTFNKHKIKHQFCKHCGVQPFALGQKPDGTAMVAINVRALDDVEPWSVTAKRVDGRSF